MFEFFAPKSECFTKYDAFCSYIFDYAFLGRKAYCYQKGLKLPFTTTTTSRFGFSIMCGKFCHSCFEITACSALAQFGHFAFRTRVPFQKKGVLTPQTSPGCATDKSFTAPGSLGLQVYAAKEAGYLMLTCFLQTG